jgi:hypothetical protein
MTTPGACVAFVDSSNVGLYTKTFTIKTAAIPGVYSGTNDHLITPSLQYSNQGVKFNLTFGSINNFYASFC